jgi:hypothetical protein
MVLASVTLLLLTQDRQIRSRQDEQIHIKKTHRRYLVQQFIVGPTLLAAANFVLTFDDVNSIRFENAVGFSGGVQI